MTNKVEFSGLKELKQLFDAGALIACDVVQAVMTEGYSVYFTSTAGNITYWIASHRNKGEMRTFKTFEAAKNAVLEVGFNKMTVHAE